MANPIRKLIKPKDPERRMELVEHLAELRTRIMRIGLWIILGGCIGYYKFQFIYNFIFAPMQAASPGKPIQLRFDTFTAPFFVTLEISVVAGAILMAPFVMMEFIGFFGPALTPEEKRPLRLLAPMSMVLFFSGVSLAYWVSKYAINWFLGFIDLFPNGILMQDPRAYVVFMLKMMGIFGVVFQLPVVLAFLAWIGLLRADGMRRTWRTAVVVISIVGLIITPSNDIPTMMMMTLPVVLLYLGSIWMVALIERKRFPDRIVSE